MLAGHSTVLGGFLLKFPGSLAVREWPLRPHGAISGSRLHHGSAYYTWYAADGRDKVEIVCLEFAEGTDPQTWVQG